MNLVKENWMLDFTANPFRELHAKMKSVKVILAHLSKSTFDNIFQQISTFEDIIKVKEIQLEINPMADNRASLNRT